MTDSRTSTVKNDRLTQWQQDPCLRESVQEELQNWGVWSYGGKTDLGYPREEPWAVSPSKCPPPCNVDKARRTEDNLVMWRLIARRADPQVRQKLATMLLILRLHYTTNKAAHTKAKIADVSRKQFYRLLEDAEYRYWVISLPDRAGQRG